MADKAVEAVKVKLELEIGDIETQVQAASESLEKLGGEKKVDITVRPRMTSGTSKFQQFLKDIGGSSGVIERKVQLEIAGDFFENLESRAKTSLKDGITKAIGDNPVEVPWTFGKGPDDPPEFRGKVLVDWDWGRGPDSAPGGGPGGPRGGPGGGGGGRGYYRRGPYAGGPGPYTGGGEPVDPSEEAERRERQAASRASRGFYRRTAENMGRRLRYISSGQPDPGGTRAGLQNAAATAAIEREEGEVLRERRSAAVRTRAAVRRTDTGLAPVDLPRKATPLKAFPTPRAPGEIRRRYGPAIPPGWTPPPDPGSKTSDTGPGGGTRPCPIPGCTHKAFKGKGNLTQHLKDEHGLAPSSATSASAMSPEQYEQAEQERMAAAREASIADATSRGRMETEARGREASASRSNWPDPEGAKRKRSAAAYGRRYPRQAQRPRPAPPVVPTAQPELADPEIAAREGRPIAQSLGDVTNPSICQYCEKRFPTEDDRKAHIIRMGGAHEKPKRKSRLNETLNKPAIGLSPNLSLDQAPEQGQTLQELQSKIRMASEASVASAKAVSEATTSGQIEVPAAPAGEKKGRKEPVNLNEVGAGKKSRQKNFRQSGAPSAGSAGKVLRKGDPGYEEQLKSLQQTDAEAQAALAKAQQEYDAAQKAAGADQGSAEKRLMEILSSAGSWDDNERWVPASESGVDLFDEDAFNDFMNGLDAKDRAQVGKALGLWLDPNSRFDLTDEGEGTGRRFELAKHPALQTAFMGILARRAEAEDARSQVKKAGARGTRGSKNVRAGGERVYDEERPKRKRRKDMSPEERAQADAEKAERDARKAEEEAAKPRFSTLVGGTPMGDLPPEDQSFLAGQGLTPAGEDYDPGPTGFGLPRYRSMPVIVDGKAVTDPEGNVAWAPDETKPRSDEERVWGTRDERMAEARGRAKHRVKGYRRPDGTVRWKAPGDKFYRSSKESALDAATWGIYGEISPYEMPATGVGPPATKPEALPPSAGGTFGSRPVPPERLPAHQRPRPSSIDRRISAARSGPAPIDLGAPLLPTGEALPQTGYRHGYRRHSPRGPLTRRFTNQVTGQEHTVHGLIDPATRWPMAGPESDFEMGRFEPPTMAMNPQDPSLEMLLATWAGDINDPNMPDRPVVSPHPEAGDPQVSAMADYYRGLAAKAGPDLRVSRAIAMEDVAAAAGPFSPETPMQIGTAPKRSAILEGLPEERDEEWDLFNLPPKEYFEYHPITAEERAQDVYWNKVARGEARAGASLGFSAPQAMTDEDADADFEAYLSRLSPFAGAMTDVDDPEETLRELLGESGSKGGNVDLSPLFEKFGKKHARGFFGRAKGETSLTPDTGTSDIAGEAGDESVVILRNPRPFDPTPVPDVAGTKFHPGGFAQRRAEEQAAAEHARRSEAARRGAQTRKRNSAARAFADDVMAGVMSGVTQPQLPAVTVGTARRQQAASRLGQAQPPGEEPIAIHDPQLEERQSVMSGFREYLDSIKRVKEFTEAVKSATPAIEEFSGAIEGPEIPEGWGPMYGPTEAPFGPVQGPQPGEGAPMYGPTYAPGGPVYGPTAPPFGPVHGPTAPPSGWGPFHGPPIPPGWTAPAAPAAGPAVGAPAAPAAAAPVTPGAAAAAAAPAGGGAGAGAPDAFWDKRIAAIIGGEARRTELDKFTEMEARVQGAKQMTPARAFTTSVAQLSEQVTGRGGIQRRAKDAERAIANARAVTAARVAEEVELTKMQTQRDALVDAQNRGTLSSGQAKRLRELESPEGIAAQEANVQRFTGPGGYEQVYNERAEKASKSVLQRGDVTRNLVSGFVGLMGATIAMKAVFGALNTAVSGASDAFGELVERDLLGYSQTTSKLTMQLGEATKQQDGNAQAVVATTLALSGLNKVTAGQIAPDLTRRSEVIAGNAAMADRNRLTATAGQIKSINGYDENLIRSVGGLLNTGIGIPGVAESSQPTAERLQQSLGQVSVRPKDATSIGNNNPWGDARDPVAVALESVLGGITGTPTASNNPDDTKWLKERADKVGELNNQAEAAGNSLKVLAGSSDEQTEASKRTVKVLGELHGGLASEFLNKNLSFEGLSGNDAEAKSQILEWLSAQNKLVTTPEQLIAGNERQRTASIHDIQRQRQVGLDVMNPAQTAMQYLARPMLPYGQTLLKSGAPAGNRPTENLFAGRGKAFDKGYEEQVAAYDKAFTKYGTDAVAAQEAVNKRIEKGRQALRELGVPEDTIKSIETLGIKMQEISSGLSQRQLNLTVSGYSNQIRIANRSLRDANDMWDAIGGSVKDTLGGMQGQNLVLSRQLQLLGFEMEQRTINFKLAMAGFTAPGDTPEQRQARIEQAKKEADYAQKQLNIQKQMGSNEFRINTKQVRRSITDLQAEIDQLVEARSLAVDTDAAQKAYEALSAEQQTLLEDAKTWESEGLNFIALMNSEMKEIEARTGAVIDAFAPGLVQAFADAGAAMGDAVKAAMTGNGAIGSPTTGPTAAQHTDTNPNDAGRSAGGFYGSFSSPTMMTVGEAGTETIAVLRNPRTMTMPGSGGGGGGGPMVFNINISGGGSDIEQKKLHAWAREIAQMVETSLNRRTSMLGLRAP